MENAAAAKEELEVLEIDDHALHADAHTAYLLSADGEKLFKRAPEVRERLLEHVRLHALASPASKK
jgi:hypothetical protein